MDENKALWFPKFKNQKILAPGIYHATLKSVVPGVGKGYASTEERPTLMFSFVEEEQQAVINRTCSAVISPKAQLTNLVRSMSGSTPPDAETLNDPELLKNFILNLVGKKYLVQVEPSKDGRFNNLITAFPSVGPSHARR